MKEQVLIYEVKSRSVKNAKVLLSPDEKFFYWNAKKFKKLQVGDYALIINTYDNYVLFTKLDQTGILVTNASGKTSFEDKGNFYDVNGNYGDFIRLSIIKILPTPNNWKWKTLGNSEIAYLNGPSVNTDTSDNRLNNINSLKSLTDDKQFQHVLAICEQNFRYSASSNSAVKESKKEPAVERKTSKPNIWIEKTILKSRPDRKAGELAFGKVLWSPQRSKTGGDIYKEMTKVRPNDLILHLTDNLGITAVSKVAEPFYEGESPKDTDWEGETYVIPLKQFKQIEILPRQDFLNDRYKNRLLSIAKLHGVFYNVKLNLNQGKYLSHCPEELASLLNEAYQEKYGTSIPYLNNLAMGKRNEKQEAFNYKAFNSDVKQSNLMFSNLLVKRFIASLQAKPFLILTGLAGSGKTKLATSFAKWITKDKKQTCLISVGADWVNREPLLGFPNVLESNKYVKPDNGVLQLLIDASRSENSNKPYFLILDEMNLSHVERYFSDFLSAMESGGEICLHSQEKEIQDIPPAITIPKNLFIIGTVNIDETTYMFSPKVLDRANAIEFRISKTDLETYLKSDVTKPSDDYIGKGIAMSSSFLSQIDEDLNLVDAKEDINNSLKSFFDELKKVGAEFGYRVVLEIFHLINRLHAIEEPNISQSLDIAIVQKLLPKLHGSRRKLTGVLEALANLCITDKGKNEGITIESDIDAIEKTLEKEIKNEIEDQAQKCFHFPITFEKVQRMYKNAVRDGFTSFAEA